jgi:DNA repair protein RAD16
MILDDESDEAIDLEESDEDEFIISDDDCITIDSNDDDDAPLAVRRGLAQDADAVTISSGTTTPADPTMNAVRIAARNRGFRRARARRNREPRPDPFEPYDRKKARRKKLENSHPEIKTMWDKLEEVTIVTPVPAEQPEAITRRLKGFQLEGLNWMMRQESESQWKGGLLGDEMGMGKTIQAVSLIMSDHPAKDPTLVLVPPVALMQWANEIKDYTSGKLNVLICHGSNKDAKQLNPKKIRSYDVIVMSYNSLESMFRKQEKGWSRGEYLVKEASPIHAVHFHRLILDEAHSIKQRTTGVAKACFALKGTYKWCLSGTPVQNRIGEFFSLLRFLEVRPFADYFCEKCPCAQLHWTIDENSFCTHCKHASSEHRSVFNEELLNPITGDSMSARRAALDKLHMITARVMLRRMKKDHTSSMELPPKEIIIHNEFFGEIERDFSSSIMSNTSRQFDTYVSRGVMLNNYANIFGLIMQMRQVANHPDLLLKKHAEGGQNALVCNICDEIAEEAIRSRCHHEFCRSCARSYVQSYEGSGSEGADCPRCHIPLVIDWEQPDIEQDEEQVKKSSIINRIKMENWTSSTKIEMLVYDLYKLRSRKQTLKSIVFSQFTSMLQLIEWRLRRAGFNTVMLDGSMTPIQRQRSIDYFMKNPDVEVFLVSLKAGGVALNLTEASRVFIVDPWWNPAAEWQSADRCHRIGQTRPCVITRLVIEDSVESRMVMLQEKKAKMISGTINNDKVAMDKLSPEDLQFLFRGS